MDKPTLIYFPLRARAEIIRLVCAEAGIDYEEHPIGKGSPPKNGRPTDFGELKASGALPFDAVPVWEEPDGFRLAQSRAIENYLARTHGLYGKSDREAAQIDQVLGAQDDIRNEIRKIPAAPMDKRGEVRAQLTSEALPRWTRYLERLLAANRDGSGFFVGGAVSVADLAIYFCFEMMRENDLGASIDSSRLLNAFMERVASRPHIKAYIDSPKRHPKTVFAR